MSGPPLVTSDLSRDERTALEFVWHGIDDGLQLYRWWNENHLHHRLERIPVALQLDRPAWNYGFLQDIPLHLGLLPCLGVAQDMLYYRPKAPESQERNTAQWYRDQLCEYALRYFFRVAWSQQPSVPTWRELEANPDRTLASQGWKWEQIFYKRKRDGEVGRFPRDQRYRIIDLRRIGEEYQWVIFRVKLLDFVLSKSLFSFEGPQIQVPFKQDVYVVMNGDMIVNRSHPEPGVLGEYGAGWSVIPVPRPGSILAYGPNHLITAFEMLHFRILENGEIWAKMVFISNQPNRLFNIKPLDIGLSALEFLSLGLASPFTNTIRNFANALNLPNVAYDFTSIGLANTFTGNEATRLLDISMDRAMKDIMAAHFLDLYQFLLQTQQTWSIVPDFLDTENLPEWLRA